MNIKKSNFLKDCFKLSSFSIKIYNVNAGNRCYASVSSVRKRGYIEQYVNLTCALGSAHVKFDV